MLIVGGSAGGLIGSPAQAAGKTLRDMLAAQIPMQGAACDKPLSVLRDAKHSKPDHALWVLGLAASQTWRRKWNDFDSTFRSVSGGATGVVPLNNLSGAESVVCVSVA
jgi:hypothetical protein